ncbi:hypothetical protein X975_09247, partial [Stegodyphus mimosarum]
MKVLPQESDNENSIGAHMSPEDSMATDSSSDISENRRLGSEIQVGSPIGIPFVGSLCYLPYEQTGELLAFSMGNQQNFNPRRKKSSRSRF